MGERERERGMERGREVRGGRRERGRLRRVAFPNSTTEIHCCNGICYLTIWIAHCKSKAPKR